MDIFKLLSIDPATPECLPIPAKVYDDHGMPTELSPLYIAAVFGLLGACGINEDNPIKGVYCAEGGQSWPGFEAWLEDQPAFGYQSITVSFAGAQDHPDEYLCFGKIWVPDIGWLFDIGIGCAHASAISDWYCTPAVYAALAAKFGEVSNG